MTNEERDLINQFIQRVAGPPAGGGFAGSVPTTTALPPVDREADALLADLFQRFPEARYRVTQYAFIQEHALAEAQNAIRQLQAQLSQAQAQLQAQAQQPQAQPAPSPWGAAVPRGSPPQQPAYAPPPPQYAPGYQPGMFQQQGPGFLGSALRTAAGVAGGMLAMDALSGLFGGRGFGGGLGGFGGGFGGGGFAGGGNTTIVENNYGGGDPYDQGGAPKDFDQGGGGGWTDNSGGADPGGWTDDSGGGDPGSDMGGDAGGFDSDPNSI